ncbi:DCC1-like thiol-disulfide oxidoreductase family protein [Flavihumibacter sp. UBA7668]|uniref:DCC1-like thiol-disulfide oxidoreductase family protein n=1 Tax=Flavihumibacter sp. UBA7668 TaxID=1946542 RepID=UPI0025BD9702|nr:DCC1-like thiol-disulfide oxidoreductase family protein [Flavihumibacter sp. UBA7668]
MKTLHGFIILYDADCPLCRVYTNDFVQTGMLDMEGRQSYQEMPATCAVHVNQQKAVNEIALVNPVTGEVYYGIESLLKILGHAWPVFRPLFSCGFFIGVMKILYRLISYNRRVFLPVAVGTESEAAQPGFHRGYRAAFLVFSWLLVSMILHWYGAGMEPVLTIGEWYREPLICGGQLLFQGLVVGAIAPRKIWDYLGNLMVVSMLGAIALLFSGLILKAATAGAIWYAGAFLLTVGAMLLEHARRCKLLEMGIGYSISWVLYRILLVGILINGWL